MKVYKFVHVQMNEFPEGHVKQHSHDEFEKASLGEGRLTGERTGQETQRVSRLFSIHHGVLFYKIIL